MVAPQPIPDNPRFQDLTDQPFGEWVVVHYCGKVGETSRWWCRCSCGTEKVVQGNNLTSGKSQSCGCRKSAKSRQAARTHGMKGTAEYTAWQAMKDRCFNPRAKNYPHYGGRGISVCRSWRSSFASFFADMGFRPSLAHSLERIDNDGDYEPGNVRWATMAEQSLNRRNNRLVTFRGETLPLSEWCRRTGINFHTACGRLDRGWTVVDALSIPPGFFPRVSDSGLEPA